MKKPRCPSWGKFWRVDQVIECLSFGDKREMVERELLKAMPDAYEDKRPPDNPNWKPGDEGPKNEFPPDADTYDLLRQTLNHAWRNLPLEVQEAIIQAFKDDGVTGDEDEGTSG